MSHSILAHRLKVMSFARSTMTYRFWISLVRSRNYDFIEAHATDAKHNDGIISVEPVIRWKIQKISKHEWIWQMRAYTLDVAR